MRAVKLPIGSILITETMKLLSIKSTLIIVLRQYTNLRCTTTSTVISWASSTLLRQSFLSFVRSTLLVLTRLRDWNAQSTRALSNLKS